jgi:hypothetical protein
VFWELDLFLPSDVREDRSIVYISEFLPYSQGNIEIQTDWVCIIDNVRVYSKTGTDGKVTTAPTCV